MPNAYVVKKYLESLNNPRCYLGLGIVCIYLFWILLYGYAEKYPLPMALIGLFLCLSFFSGSRRKRCLSNGTDEGVIRHEAIHLPSSSLVISTHASSDSSDFILQTPTRLTASIQLWIHDGNRTVKSIRLEGEWKGRREEKQTMQLIVDGGFLFLGDPAFSERLRRAGAVDSEVSRICHPAAELPYALFHDSGIGAMVVLTGEGDDSYEMEIETKDDGKFVLSVDFYYYERTEGAPDPHRRKTE